MRHLRCASWALAGALLGVAVVAYGQATGTSPDAVADHGSAVAVADPTVAILSQLLAGGGLPAVLGLGAWWLRGQLGAGIPILVSLHPDDRRLLRRVIREVAQDDSDDSTPDTPDRR